MRASAALALMIDPMLNRQWYTHARCSIRRPCGSQTQRKETHDDPESQKTEPASTRHCAAICAAFSRSIPTSNEAPASTGQSLAAFNGRWAGDDLDERLAEVYQMRGQVVAE